MAKYCIYCGKSINETSKKCPFCYEDVTEESENKKYHSGIRCIKCESENVTFQITKKNIHGIVHEEEVYECKDCGKKFKDNERLGSSWSNGPHVILSRNSKKLIIWCIIIAVIAWIVISNYIEKERIYNNTEKLDCNGLKTMTFRKIQSEAEEYMKLDETRNKYVGKSYIFNVKVKEIKGRKITHIEGTDGKYAYSYITVNKDELEKIKEYKEGDTIKICGTVDEITGFLYSVEVKNATIIGK